MTSVLRHQELAIIEKSEVAVVPDDNKAKLMFYLRCICDLLDMEGEDEQLDKLADYMNHDLLSEDETDTLTIMCMTMSPDVISGRVIFMNNDMCGNSQNRFYELEAVRRIFMISNTVMVGDQERRVRKVMFYKDSWLREHYISPMQQMTLRLGQRIAITEHVCQGKLPNFTPKNNCCIIQ